MKIQWKKLIASIAIPLAVGGAAAFLSRDGIQAFEALQKPTLTPPGWIFPIAWTILYILMGIASYLVIVSEKEHRAALTLYAVSLVFNFLWPILFFGFGLYLFAFIWLVVLWILILLTAAAFFRISEPAGYLMVPYLLWVTFAGYLNFMIYLLN